MTRKFARAFVALLLVCIAGAWSVNAEATTVKHRTIVDLIAERGHVPPQEMTEVHRHQIAAAQSRRVSGNCLTLLGDKR